MGARYFFNGSIVHAHFWKLPELENPQLFSEKALTACLWYLEMAWRDYC
jgi:hypothetical protein